MKCNTMTIEGFTDKLPYIPAVSYLIHTLSTRFYYKITYKILSNYKFLQYSEYSYWNISNNINVILTVTFSKLEKISLQNTCRSLHGGSHFGYYNWKTLYCLQCTDNPPEGRIHVLDCIQQVFQESIDHVDDLEVSETHVSYVIQMALHQVLMFR